jgi:hypothetical protein
MQRAREGRALLRGTEGILPKARTIVQKLLATKSTNEFRVTSFVLFGSLCGRVVG